MEVPKEEAPKEHPKGIPAPPAPPEERLHPRNVTLEDIERVRDYRDFLHLALDVLTRGPWVLNLGQQSLGLVPAGTVAESRRLGTTMSSSRRALKLPAPPGHAYGLSWIEQFSFCSLKG